MQVYINDKNSKRKLVSVKLVKTNKRTVLVKLPDGNIIKRKKEEVKNDI